MSDKELAEELIKHVERRLSARSIKINREAVAEALYGELAVQGKIQGRGLPQKVSCCSVILDGRFNLFDLADVAINAIHKQKAF